MSITKWENEMLKLQEQNTESETLRRIFHILKDYFCDFIGDPQLRHTSQCFDACVKGDWCQVKIPECAEKVYEAII